MKYSKTTFWTITTIGALGTFSSIFSFSRGADFNSYFWGGFCGVILIGSAWIEQKKERIN